MRTTKKIVASVLAVCMAASASVVSAFAATTVDEELSANEYNVANQAVDNEYTYNGGDLGANYSPEKTVFKVWAPKSTEVTLNRFATGSDSEPGAENLGSVKMEKLNDGDKWTGVWTATVEGDIVNTYYTYTVTSTLIDKSGVAIAEPQVAETQDVYSVATGVNGRRSMVCDLSKTNPEGWDSDTHVLPEEQTDSQVWEVHVKDFTWDASSGISDANRGKYLGFTETGTTVNNEGIVSTCVDYLKQLGVTTVQINPFYDFQSINEAGSQDQFNWGYDPQNYNVPEGSYSSNPYDGNVRIQECKAMIKALHDAGISVVMDVVYNHTYSCSAQDSCFQATVPYYYHRMRSTGVFSDGSGCGNEVATEFAMARQYIVDSCKYWVNEYHIDGFRFDLMGLMDAECMNQIRDELDSIDPKLTMWGEGWTGGTSYHNSKTYTGAKYVASTQANAASLNSRIAFFNDQIRNGIKGTVFDINEKGFIAGNHTYTDAVKGGIRANTTADAMGWKSPAPSQTVSYAACHDNATLYDQITASNKKQWGVRDDDSVKMSKLASAILNTSQGVTFYLAGDEMARTKFGDTNSYKSSPEINKINWENLIDYPDLVSYYSGMISIKKAFSPFRVMDKSYEDAFQFSRIPISGKDSDGNDIIDAIAYTVQNDTAGEWNKLAVLYNGSAKERNITLDDKSVTSWVVVANDRTAGLAALDTVEGSTFTLPAFSAVVAVDKASFDDTALESDKGYVKVNYKYESEDGIEVASSIVVSGTIGSGYQLKPSAGVDKKYEFSSVIGNAEGTYSDEPQEVTFIYTNYIPETLRMNGDLDGDGEISILDVVYLEKILVDKLPMPNKDLDFNCDGGVDIFDVIMMRRHLVDYNVATGDVEINYYYTDDKGKVDKFKDSTINIHDRVGERFEAKPYVVMGYALDESKLPSITEGKVAYGSKTVINYYYVPGNRDVNLHFKHSGSLTWDPYLWIWASDLDGNHLADINFTGGTWAGKPAVDDDGDGWYDYSFTYQDNKGGLLAGTYNVIVSANSSGANQTIDYEGFADNEMWVVIDDSKVGSSGEYLTFYTENPDV